MGWELEEVCDCETNTKMIVGLNRRKEQEQRDGKWIVGKSKTKSS